VHPKEKMKPGLSIAETNQIPHYTRDCKALIYYVTKATCVNAGLTSVFLKFANVLFLMAVRSGHLRLVHSTDLLPTHSARQSLSLFSSLFSAVIYWDRHNLIAPPSRSISKAKSHPNQK